MLAIMHNPGCPKRNSPYAECECAAIEQREHTEQLLRYNKNAPTAEMVNQLQAEITELREQPATSTGVLLHLESLQAYWECKAQDCEQVEIHYSACDRVTSQQAKTSKEVYRTCIRELRASLAASETLCGRTK